MATSIANARDESNRLLAQLYEYEKEKAAAKQANPGMPINDRAGRDLRKAYFRSLVNAERQKRQKRITISSFRTGVRRLLNFLKPVNLLLTIILLPFQIL